MASGFDMVIAMAIPLLQWGMYTFLFALIVVPAGYYFLVVGRRRTWIARIWERQGEHDAVLVGKDKIVERRLKGKNGHLYELRKRRYPVHPILEENVIRFRNKKYVDYLQIGSDFVPFITRYNFKAMTKELEPMPYDVQMQMISVDKLMEEIYKTKSDFFGKYGAFIGLALIVVLMVILMNLYFDFVSSSLEPVKQSVGVLQQIASNMGGK